METLKWFHKNTRIWIKKLAKYFVILFLVMLFVPASFLTYLKNKIAFAELRLPTPRAIPVATMHTIQVEDSSLMRSGFTTLIQSISLLPRSEIRQGDVVYGYARTDLFEVQDGTMWVVIRTKDGAPIATARAYTTYYAGGFGFVPFSVRIPALLTSGNCLLEFRKENPKMIKLSDILFTSMPVTCVATTVGGK